MHLQYKHNFKCFTKLLWHILKATDDMSPQTGAREDAQYMLLTQILRLLVLSSHHAPKRALHVTWLELPLWSNR